jgi:hypothetical protein
MRLFGVVGGAWANQRMALIDCAGQNGLKGDVTL